MYLLAFLVEIDVISMIKYVENYCGYNGDDEQAQMLTVPKT